MFHKVDTWFDPVELEHRILARWKEEGSFDELRRRNASGPAWSFLDGPITANNPMGVHHAWGRTLKDVYQRFHAMCGARLRYQNGFDCQGLWVEVEVEKELGFRTKRDIEAYGIANFVERCKERVLKYSAIQTEQSIRLGYWMDWSDSYFTMSDENNYMIWSFLKRCHERGFVYHGHDVMPWCPRCGVGLSQHEMQEGYRTVDHASIVARFPLREREGEALLVWTTTPWTLTSNVAVAVHPELTYAKVRQGGQTYYLAEARREQVLASHGPHEVVERLPGSRLVGLTYDGPFDELAAQEVARTQHRVIAWPEVSEGEGTGLVHIAPGCGAEDFALGAELGLEALCPIGEDGRFLPGFEPYTGTLAYDMVDPVTASLSEKGLLHAREDYTHNYPHCWRCGSELLFRKDGFWFIAMDAWRDEIMEVARQIRWIPSYGLDLELDWLRNMRDWMISKKRFWGLALPIWICDDAACGGFDVIGSREELAERAIRGFDHFDGHSPHRPFVDEVVVACPLCGGDAHRTRDVGNPWLDAGIVPYSTMGYRADRAYWEEWFPAKLVLECFPGQFRNWFYALLAMSTMLERRPPFETLLGHALVRDEHGREMHKSTGNAIWFDDAVEQIGADVMRWLYVSQDPTSNLNFGFGPAREVRGKVINTFWNCYAFFCNYARLADFVPSAEPVPWSQRTDLDRWILSHLQRLVATTRDALSDFRAQQVTRECAEFLDKLSNWYIRHSRRRLWKSGEEADTLSALDTLYRCLETLLRVAAPVLPFLTEEMYGNLVRGADPDAPASVHHTAFPTPREDWVDEGLMRDMDALRRLTSLGLSAREQAGVKVRQPLPECRVRPGDAGERAAAERFADRLREILNVKALTVLAPGEGHPVTRRLKPDFGKLGPRLGKGVKAAVAALAALDQEEAADRVEAGEPLVVQADGVAVEIAPAEVTVETGHPGWLAGVEEGATWIGVDTRIDEVLAREGLMRDLLRRLQSLRKDVGLEIEDRVRVRLHTGSGALLAVLAEWRDHLAAELLCEAWSETEEPDDAWHELRCGDEVCQVEVVRVG